MKRVPWPVLAVSLTLILFGGRTAWPQQRAQWRGAAKDQVRRVPPPPPPGHPSVTLEKYYRLANKGGGRGPDPELTYFGYRIGVGQVPEKPMWLDICDAAYATKTLEADECSGPAGLRAPRTIKRLENVEKLKKDLPSEPTPGKYYILIWREDREQGGSASVSSCPEVGRPRPFSRTRICGWSSYFWLGW